MVVFMVMRSGRVMLMVDVLVIKAAWLNPVDALWYE
jgi:hypothetical protein